MVGEHWVCGISSTGGFEPALAVIACHRFGSLGIHADLELKTEKDIRTAFKLAAGFERTANRLRQGPIATTEDAAPLIVLEAFATELLLKVLIAMSGKAPPRHHFLDKLFFLLPAAQQVSVSRRWDATGRPRIEQWCASMGKPADLPTALATCNTAFADVRYWYEDPDKPQFYLGDLPRLLMMEIADLKPGWVQLSADT